MSVKAWIVVNISHHKNKTWQMALKTNNKTNILNLKWFALLFLNSNMHVDKQLLLMYNLKSNSYYFLLHLKNI